MSLGADLLLVAAGIAGGLLNAVAGGGSFITFAILVFVGVPSVVANATTSVGLFPGALTSAWTYRKLLPTLQGLSTRAIIVISLAGSIVGALLLIWTPQHDFDVLVPWLLLAATLVFTFGRYLTRALARIVTLTPFALGCVQFVIAIYGGYFGGAMGILMLAAFALYGLSDLNSANALKTLLAGLLNAVAVAVFIVAGKIDWAPAAILVFAGIFGGWLGAWGAKKMNPAHLRILVIVIASTITLIFFLKG